MQDRAKYNPFDSASMCHNPLPRDALESFLKTNGGISLNPDLLDELYKAMDTVVVKNPMAEAFDEESVAPSNEETTQKLAGEPKWMNAQQRQAFVDLLDTSEISLEQTQVANRILADTRVRLDVMELPELPPPGVYSGAGGSPAQRPATHIISVSVADSVDMSGSDSETDDDGSPTQAGRGAGSGGRFGDGSVFDELASAPVRPAALARSFGRDRLADVAS